MARADEERIEGIVQSILEDYTSERVINRLDIQNQPDKQAIIGIVDKLMKILFPGYYSDRVYKIYSLKNNMAAAIEDVIYHLNKQIRTVLQYSSDYVFYSEEQFDGFVEKLSLDFMEKIPMIREMLEYDVEAFFEGDPAASSRAEIILSYPGFYAVSVYRLAHELFMLKVPMIPRIMTEHAHSLTGIDIHPGATIGRYFFMDHGTGIVVGETTVIGDHVKVYQGVTLGALSTKGGQKLKNVRRHPTIEDNVTIYSNASILGGQTVIGEGAVIGGSAFITESVPKGARVSAN
ncbi:MAG: serine acetyltransferase [Lachnospiraceae bacterium]|nr:serine acetyltransferase [Lachnospiraceae bacterium]